jgi:hypothetical protein
MADPKDDPSTQSGERKAMDPDWTLIDDVLGGAKVIRDKGATYLPKYEGEGQTEYDRRRHSAPWRPEFADALKYLASKPFGHDVALKGDMPERIKDLAEDIDGRGNNLTQVGADVFSQGIARGLQLILVDFPTMAPNATRAEERAANARPYWVAIPTVDIIALYTDWVGGKETVVHLRYRETVTVRDKFGETVRQRIRVYEPGIWQIWEQDPDTKRWGLAENGSGVIARGSKRAQSVPVALFFTGERTGEMKVKPPLADLARMQIELYQALSREDEALTFASSPILTGNGLAPPANDAAPIVVGPKAVLFAPPGGEGTNPHWSYINPDAANIEQIREHVRSVIDDMRRLGMQPLTQRSGTPTATGVSVNAAQAHSQVQAWAVALKDVLEQAWVFTCEWLSEPTTVECHVNTDFSVLPYADAPLQALDKARARRDICVETYWDGMKRFEVLPPDFDPVAEKEKIRAELAIIGASTERDPATSKKIDVDVAATATNAARPAKVTVKSLLPQQEGA